MSKTKTMKDQTHRSKKNQRYQRLHKGGKIDWTIAENLCPIHIAVNEFPFHAKVLARKYGISTSAVYYRLRQHGISLHAMRDGVAGKGKEVLRKYSVKRLSVTKLSEMEKTHVSLFRKDTKKNGTKAKKS